MQFDTVIIGGGLAGMICGIKLSRQGQRCAIVSSGQSALHFMSGSFDLLNRLPDGELVTEPLVSVKELIKQSPTHPYTKLGEEKFSRLTEEAEDFFRMAGLLFKGSSEKNHFRITPMGAFKPTWLTLSEFISCEKYGELPYSQCTIFTPAGFLDFYPDFISYEFRKYGVNCKTHIFDLPDLEFLRRNPSEMRSTSIGRVLDKPENRKQVANIILRESREGDTIILPACLGIESPEIIQELERETGKLILLIATAPPSLPGIRMQQYLKQYFISLGGTYMMGDNIVKADVNGDRIERIYSFNHGDIPFESNQVVLATGSYFSRGLIATREEVIEPVFGLDVSYMTERPGWYAGNIFESQPYQHFGVRTTNDFRALKEGKPIKNLYVAGAILEGFNPIKEGTGGGVSILTGLEIADTILKT